MMNLKKIGGTALRAFPIVYFDAVGSNTLPVSRIEIFLVEVESVLLRVDLGVVDGDDFGRFDLVIHIGFSWGRSLQGSGLRAFKVAFLNNLGKRYRSRYRESHEDQHAHARS